MRSSRGSGNTGPIGSPPTRTPKPSAAGPAQGADDLVSASRGERPPGLEPPDQGARPARGRVHDHSPGGLLCPTSPGCRRRFPAGLRDRRGVSKTASRALLGSSALATLAATLQQVPGGRRAELGGRHRGHRAGRRPAPTSAAMAVNARVVFSFPPPESDGKRGGEGREDRGRPGAVVELRMQPPPR